MNAEQGLFIVLEGTDGSGKSTQFKLLHERLRAVGFEVETFKFPRYHKTSSHFVQRYLNGDYGPAEKVNPYTASLFYALDRFEASSAIRKALNAGKIVLADRFVGSNMAHQGSKISDPVQQRGFFVWEDGLEFQLLGIPRPNFNFFLRVPAEIAFRLMEHKSRDQHESNIDHLQRTVATYETLAQLFPKDFQTIECIKNGKMLSVAEINDKIWNKLKPLLPHKPPHAARDLVVRFDESARNPELGKISEEIVPASKELPHSGTINLNINKISLLAIAQIRSNQNINCRVTAVDWATGGGYNFYTPADLSKNVAQIYTESMHKLVRLHRQMAKVASKNSQIEQATTASIPLAALASAKISGTPEQLLELIEQMQASLLAEAHWLAAQLAGVGRKIYPEQFKNIQTPSQPSFSKEETYDVISKLVSEHLPQTLPAQTEDVSLLEATPRNEFNVLADSLYSYSTSSRAEITEQLDSWTYQQKAEALLATASRPDTQALQQTNYLWNIICDSRTFEDLRAALNLKNVKMQPFTPRYGYNVPVILEENGLDEVFLESFDESLRLFSSLQAADLQTTAAYATLLGHKNRWQFTTSAAALQKSADPINSDAKTIYDAMLEKTCETHPLLGGLITRQNKKSSHAQPGQSQKTSSGLRPKSKKRTRKSKK